MKMNLANIKKAKKILDNNECVAIPTETVYGLAGNAYSNKACKNGHIKINNKNIKKVFGANLPPPLIQFSWIYPRI